MQYYEVKTSYTGVDDKGKEKKFKPTLLINAETFGDAETQAYEELDGHPSLEIQAIKRSTINEVTDGDAGLFFLVVTEFTTVDESSGKEKKSKHESLISALDTTEATNKLKENFAEYVIPYEVRKVIFSPISQLVNI